MLIYNNGGAGFWNPVHRLLCHSLVRLVILFSREEYFTQRRKDAKNHLVPSPFGEGFTLRRKDAKDLTLFIPSSWRGTV